MSAHQPLNPTVAGLPRRCVRASERTYTGLAHTLPIIFVLSWFIPEQVFLPVGSLQITPLRALGMVAFVSIVLGGRVRWVWPDALMFAMFGLQFYAFARTADTPKALEAVGREFLDFAVPYLLGRVVAEDPPLLRRLLRLAVTLLAVFSAVSVLESLLRWNIHQQLWGLLVQTPGVYPEQRMGLTRAMGWTSHPIMFGLVLTAFLPFALDAALDRSGAIGPMPWARVASLLVGVYCSMSSGAWIATGVVLALVLWDRRSGLRAPVKWGMFFVGVPLLWGILEVLSTRSLLRFLMMKFHLSSSDAWVYRWQLNQRVWAIMPGHWWLGYGLALPEEFTGDVGRSVDQHFLCIILFTGLIGLHIWVALMASIIFYKARAVWFSDEPRARVARACGFVVLAYVTAQFSVALFSTAAIVLWFIMGVGISAGRRCALSHALVPNQA